MGIAPGILHVSLTGWRDWKRRDQRTTNATKGTDTLSRSRELIAVECTRDEAVARSVGEDSANALDDARCGRCTRGNSSRGSSNGRSTCRRSTRSGGGSGGATSDGAAATVAALINGQRLEHGVGLVSGRVDGEDHALAAVVGLTAVEPFSQTVSSCCHTSDMQGRQLTERSVDHDLHGNLRRGVDSVVGVGLEARVHTAGQRITGCFERGLRYGVVLAAEGEDDGITDGDGHLRGVELQTLRTANRDAVGSTGAGNDLRRASSESRRCGHLTGNASNWGRTGRSASGGSSDTTGDGLGDRDGLSLVENGGRRASADVDPKNVDIGTAAPEEAERPLQLRQLNLRCSHPVDRHLPELWLPLHGGDLVNRLPNRQVGHAQRQCCRELHVVLFFFFFRYYIAGEDVL